MGGSEENEDGADRGIETQSDNEITVTTQASCQNRGKSQFLLVDFLVMLVDIFHLFY